MKNMLKGFILGIVAGVMVISTVVFATNTEVRTLAAEFCGISIDVDQKQFIPTDISGKEVEPFIIDGTTYLPVRAVAEALDKEVVWNDEVKRVCIFSKSEPVTEEEIIHAFEQLYLSSESLQDYTINSVQEADKNTWRITFSVFPSEGYEVTWMAGNGVIDENGWIVEKSLFVYVVKTNGVVDLKVLGTGL